MHILSLVIIFVSLKGFISNLPAFYAYAPQGITVLSCPFHSVYLLLGYLDCD